MATDSRFHFFEVQDPGKRIERERLTVLRTHVRRAIARNKQTQPIDYTLKIVTPQNVVDRTKAAERAANRRKARKGSAIKHQKQSNSPSVYQDRSLEHLIARSPADRHPFSICAASMVDLDVVRLDHLFKSDAFRIIGEPFFDTGQVDPNRTIEKVFPCSLESPTFLYAMVYSMLQVIDRNHCTVETLHVQGKTISVANRDIATSKQPSTALLGAVMILTAAACRFDEYDAYLAHSNGLARLLELCKGRKSSVQLTPAASRAVFWLDLWSSICLDAPRRVSHHSLPDQPIWKRTNLPEPKGPCTLPTGFSRHQSLIPDDLLDCLQDIVELQSKMKDHAYRKDYMLLDTMQASIESRLSFQGRACRLFGHIAEMIRLAAFICCYCCWTDTWDSNVIPSKVAKLLLRELEDSIGIVGPQEVRWETLNKRWHGRGDLLLWLVFVGAAVTQHKEFMVGLGQRYAEVIRKVSDWVSRDVSGNMWSSSMLEAMRGDFLYPDSWKEKRLRTKEWFELEVTFGLTS